MSDSVTVTLLTVLIRARRDLVDAFRAKDADAFQAVADAFEEDVEVMVQARDEIRRLSRGGKKP
jgi:citrate lyase beta subunit